MLSTLVTLCSNVVILAAAAATTQTHKLELYPIEQHVIARTNAEPIKNGLQPLLIDQR